MGRKGAKKGGGGMKGFLKQTRTAQNAATDDSASLKKKREKWVDLQELVPEAYQPLDLKKKKNVFDGLTKEFECELQGPISDGEVSSSEDELEVKGEDIILIVQNRDEKRVRVSTTTETPFRHLFEKYRTHAADKGWIDEKTLLKFFFDDALLDENDTPPGFDCQADDITDITAYASE